MVVQNDIETGACIRTWQVHEGAARARLVAWMGSCSSPTKKNPVYTECGLVDFCDSLHGSLQN